MATLDSSMNSLFQLPSSGLSMRILSRNITKVVLRIETLLNDCLRRKKIEFSIFFSILNLSCLNKKNTNIRIKKTKNKTTEIWD